VPRPTPHTATITEAVANLVAAVTDLVTGVQGALKDAHVKEAALRTKDAAVETTAAVSAKSAKLRKALKAYWSRMKGKARQQRVAVMLKGRGLKPKRATKAKRGPGRPRKLRRKGTVA
jgi:hypothetical protein